MYTPTFRSHDYGSDCRCRISTKHFLEDANKSNNDWVNVICPLKKKMGNLAYYYMIQFLGPWPFKPASKCVVNHTRYGIGSIVYLRTRYDSRCNTHDTRINCLAIDEAYVRFKQYKWVPIEELSPLACSKRPMVPGLWYSLMITKNVPPKVTFWGKYKAWIDSSGFDFVQRTLTAQFLGWMRTKVALFKTRSGTTFALRNFKASRRLVKLVDPECFNEMIGESRRVCMEASAPIVGKSVIFMEANFWFHGLIKKQDPKYITVQHNAGETVIGLEDGLSFVLIPSSPPEVESPPILNWYSDFGPPSKLASTFCRHCNCSFNIEISCFQRRYPVCMNARKNGEKWLCEPLPYGGIDDEDAVLFLDSSSDRVIESVSAK